MLNKGIKTTGIFRSCEGFHMPGYIICLYILRGEIEKRDEHWKMIIYV